jgi:ketosteroid isomerase-like protein
MFRRLLPLCVTLLFTPSVRADEPAKEDPVHGELRTVRDSLIQAVNKNDVEAILSHLHKNVVVTWMDGTVSRHHDGVRSYYDKMMKGDQRIVDSVAISPVVDELSIIYGGGSTAVAFGSSDDDFKLRRGLAFKVHSRWTATLVKEEGKWLITAFHASASLFDNPLLNTAKQMVYWVGGIAGVGGLLLGALAARLLPKRTPRTGS